jgi:Mg-chelatase subunit ChlD
VKRLTLSLLVVLVAGTTTASVTFVAPLPGMQAIGAQPIEITTDLASVNRVEFFVDGVLAGVVRKAPWRIAHDFGNSLAGHDVAAKVFADGYRTTGAVTIRTAALTASDSYNVDMVEVPLQVRSSSTLQPGDLKVRENGINQTVREVNAQRSAAQFVFVIDRSLSMGDGKLDAALRAIDVERRLLRKDDRVSVILFNHNVARPREIEGLESVWQLFGKTIPSGGTSLRDAVASLPRAARTYAIVMTDGGDRNSELSSEDALRRISGKRTVVDALVLGRSTEFLDRAAKNTGGEVVTTSRDSLGRDLHELILDINSRYTVVYQSQGTGAGWRAISVAPSRRGIEIRSARKGYFAE